jgi:hypothetical protein
MNEVALERATESPKAGGEAGLLAGVEVASPELSNDQLERCIGGVGDIRHLLPDFPA